MRLLISVTALLLALTGLAAGRVLWVEPQARPGTPIPNMGPCGGVTQGVPLVTLLGGAILTVRFTEMPELQGSPFRISWNAGEDNASCFDSLVLLDHIPQNPRLQPTVPFTYTVDIVVPDVNCTRCTLQLVQIDTSSPQLQCNGTSPTDWTTYYSCADVSIAGSTPIPSFIPPPPPTSLPEWPAAGTPYGFESAVWLPGAFPPDPVSVLFVPKSAILPTCAAPPPACPSPLPDPGPPLANTTFSVFCEPDRRLCLTWLIDRDAIVFELHSSFIDGWSSFGIAVGEGMYGADVYIAFREGAGVRVIDGHVLSDAPEVYADDIQNVFSVSGGVESGGTALIPGVPVLVASFRRQLVTGDASHDQEITNAPQRLIWAVREQDADWTRIHNFASRAAVLVNFVDPTYIMPNMASGLVTAHGALMAAAWPFCGTLGFFIARYQRRADAWYYIHVGALVTATLLNLAGFVVIAVYVTQDERPHFVDVHAVLGAIVLIGSFTQPILGSVIHLYAFGKSGK